MPNKGRRGTVEGLGSAVTAGKLSARDAGYIRAVVEYVDGRSAGRYTSLLFLGSSENFVMLRARETGHGRDRPVLMTVPRRSQKNSVGRLRHVRAVLNAANDARIGSEYASYAWSEGKREYACLISTYHEGATPLVEYLRNGQRPPGGVVRLMIAVAEQIASIHRAGFSHGTVASLNVLVARDGPRVVGLELCQPFDVGSEDLTVGGVRPFMHPEALRRCEEARGGGEAVGRDERIIWDLYGFGQTLLEVLEAASPDVYGELTPYVQRSLRLIACRCLGGLNRPNETALGLSPGEFKHISYVSSLDAVRDLEKLVGRYDMSVHVPELDLGSPERIQVSNLAPVVLTPRLRGILRSPRFIYLGRVSQLGLIQLVYPTATHSRREHALGTYAMACEYVRWLLRDETNPFFSQVMTPTDVKALLLAALLHDLGHFPLAHDFEEADRYLFDHEVLTKQILLTDSTLRDVIEGVEPNGWAVPVQRVVSILKAKDGVDVGLVDRLLHSVISGPLDADKMDYLARDSLRTGTAYGRGIDVQRLSTTLTVILRPSGPTTYAAIGTQEKGMGPAETVAFARYTMFRSVYWHHSYRAIKSMLQFMVLDRMRYAFLADPKDYRSSLRNAISALMENARLGYNSSIVHSRTPAPGGATLSSVLPYAEDAVIRWCVENASEQTMRMYEVLSRGEWYKRLVVLSLGRDLRDTEMERLGIIYSDTDPSGDRTKQWMRRFLFQRSLQRNIETRMAALLGSDAVYRGVDQRGAFNRFVAACKQEQIILVDFPDPERTLSGDLFYLVEEDYVSRRVDTAAAFQSERSLIFHSISREFMTSIGKLRIIIRQDHRDFVHRVLMRGGIVGAVFDALNYVTSLQMPEQDDLFRRSGLD